MYGKVTEDLRPAFPRRLVVNRSVRIGLVSVMCSFVGLAAAGHVYAQEGGATPVRAMVLDLSGSLQRVTVPLFGSLAVETTVEVMRADVSAKHIADVQIISPKRLLIQGINYGTTSIVLLHSDEKQSVFEVAVELDLDRLNEAMRGIDPQSTAGAESVLGNIVLTGTVSGPNRAKRMVELAELFLPPPDQDRRVDRTVQNHLDIAGEQQVLLRCVVAEVSRRAIRDLGINGFLAGENFRDGFVVNQLDRINPINIGAAAGALVTQNMPFVTDVDGVSISDLTTLSLGFPRVQAQLFIKALADNSLLKILAEPNLVAISGETAQFLAGGEQPFPVSQGNQQVTIEWKRFGVMLSFTPIVRGNGRIRLHVRPEVSDLDFTIGTVIEGRPLPGIRSRGSDTTVELASGETIAIAGLLSETVVASARRIPGIGDMPILGALFRSVNFQRSLTELVILVTPEIIAPLDAHQKVALPTDGPGDPSDFELYALGLLEPENATGPETGLEASTLLQSEPQQLAVHGPWGHAGPNDMQ